MSHQDSQIHIEVFRKNLYEIPSIGKNFGHILALFYVESQLVLKPLLWTLNSVYGIGG